VKALPNPAILKILVEEGCGLDCSSTSELHIAAALGVTGGDVMYTSNYTSQSDLAMARELGVVINLDDASLVGSLAGVKSGGMPPLISFRLNPGLGRTDSETASNVLGGPEAKFGVPMEQVVGAYRAAKEAGATRFGMHMMTGSCVMNEEYWQETVCVLLDAVARVQRECGIPAFEFINIGGGLGIPYRANAPVVDVAALAQRLKSTMVQRWGVATAGSGQPMPALYMENGRYMTGPFGWLVSRCHAVKKAWGGGVLWPGLLHGQPHAAGHVRQLPPHHCAQQGGAGGTHPSPRCGHPV
jgi:diaminopimelate decarboxylase